MKSIELAPAEYGYLRSAAFLSADLREAVAKSSSESSPDGPITLVLEGNASERLGDALTERLAQAGFDDQYQLTTEGQILEEIIGHLSR